MTHTVETNECCNEERYDIKTICRDNSKATYNAFLNICLIQNLAYGKPVERNIEGEEPSSIEEEILWQRSMLDRINEELQELCFRLGIN